MGKDISTKAVGSDQRVDVTDSVSGTNGMLEVKRCDEVVGRQFHTCADGDQAWKEERCHMMIGSMGFRRKGGRIMGRMPWYSHFSDCFPP